MAQRHRQAVRRLDSPWLAGLEASASRGRRRWSGNEQQVAAPGTHAAPTALLAQARSPSVSRGPYADSGDISTVPRPRTADLDLLRRLKGRHPLVSGSSVRPLWVNRGSRVGGLRRGWFRVPKARRRDVLLPPLLANIAYDSRQAPYCGPQRRTDSAHAPRRASATVRTTAMDHQVTTSRWGRCRRTGRLPSAIQRALFERGGLPRAGSFASPRRRRPVSPARPTPPSAVTITSVVTRSQDDPAYDWTAAARRTSHSSRRRRSTNPRDQVSPPDGSPCAWTPPRPQNRAVRRMGAG